MATQTLSIDDFKRLPHHSSSHAQQIGQAADDMYQAASLHASTIIQFADMQSFISAAGMEQCWDSLAAIRQVEAAMGEICDHFSNTVVRDSLEITHNRVKELLRTSTQRVKQLATFVER